MNSIVSGWGRYPVREAEVICPVATSALMEHIQIGNLIPRGMGRSYGDSSLNQRMIDSSYLDHFIAFDDQSGVLSCEAGLTLNEILKLIIPKGWFLPVTPGTSYVSVGGAIASDVHGKNHHHDGCFSEYVISFDLLLGSGEILTVTRESMPELFRATCGGMGLTGFILSATLSLRKITSSYIHQKTIKVRSLEEILAAFEEHSNASYSVAWIDCLAKGTDLGRSLLMLGEHADEGRLDFDSNKSFNIPIDFPSWILNPHSVRIFNTLYYKKNIANQSNQLLPLRSYFYPLDKLRHWNRMYGRSGFVQYQFVMPKASGVSGLRVAIEKISNTGMGSFLAVLKQFGEANQNYLSFPESGYTLALDFKMSSGVIELIKELDSIVLAHGGRVYLAKDALLDEVSFKRMYPNWEVFQEIRHRYGSLEKFSSDQSRRLGLQ